MEYACWQTEQIFYQEGYERHMKIKKVAILGAGAVGSYMIWGLSERDDIELGVIAEGERAARLSANGCLINGETYRP